MKKNYCYIILAMLLSLFIYMFYRTEKTVVNEIFISIISFDKYALLRRSVTTALPLNEHIIYSLPEGLWVFCITLTSSLFFVKIGYREMNLHFVPLFFSIGLEFLQLFHVTNGRFDFWDIGASIFFWAIAFYLVAAKSTKQNILQPFAIKSYVCILSYLIVYLAHVWK